MAAHNELQVLNIFISIENIPDLNFKLKNIYRKIVIDKIIIIDYNGKNLKKMFNKESQIYNYNFRFL